MVETGCAKHGSRFNMAMKRGNLVSHQGYEAGDDVLENDFKPGFNIEAGHAVEW